MNNEHREALRTNVAVVKMHSVQRRAMEVMRTATDLLPLQRDSTGIDILLSQVARDIQHLRSELIAGPIYCEEGKI